MKEFALLKLLLIFIFIVIALRKKILVGHIFISAAALLWVLFQKPLNELPLAYFHSAIAPHAIALPALVTLLLILSNSMQRCGQLERLLACVRNSITNHNLRITLFPALIGLLPMPGGAIFSAPMVKELSADTKYTPAQLVFINYWFRHVWEYWWPLYPGILLLTSLANIPIPIYSLTAMPLSIPAIIFGIFYLKRFPQNEGNKRSSEQKVNILVFLKELIPILIAIIPGFALGLFLQEKCPNLPVPREIGLGSCILIAIFYIWAITPKRRELISEILLNKHNYKMSYTAISIMIFQGILNRSEAVMAIANELSSYNVPLLLVCLILPFITGLITGITIGFVGTSFPIIIPLLQTLSPDSNILPYMVLSLVCGFVGTLVSPTHLCLILSNEYFNAKQSEAFKYLYLPCAGMLFMGFIYFYVLRSIFVLQ